MTPYNTILTTIYVVILIYSLCFIIRTIKRKYTKQRLYVKLINWLIVILTLLYTIPIIGAMAMSKHRGFPSIHHYKPGANNPTKLACGYEVFICNGLSIGNFCLGYVETVIAECLQCYLRFLCNKSNHDLNPTSRATLGRKRQPDLPSILTVIKNARIVSQEKKLRSRKRNQNDLRECITPTRLQEAKIGHLEQNGDCGVQMVCPWRTNTPFTIPP